MRQTVAKWLMNKAGSTRNYARSTWLQRLAESIGGYQQCAMTQGPISEWFFNLLHQEDKMELYTEDDVRVFMMLALVQERLRVLKESVGNLNNKFKEFDNDDVLEKNAGRSSDEPRADQARARA